MSQLFIVHKMYIILEMFCSENSVYMCDYGCFLYQSNQRKVYSQGEKIK